jgi:uncharacterized integral membrane protein
MKVLIWIFRIFVFTSILTFALNNTQDAYINLFPGVPELSFIAPLILWIFVAFFLGVLFTIIFLLPTIFKNWKYRRNNAS